VRRTASEKMEIICLVEGSGLPVKMTLRQLGVPRRTTASLGYDLREGAI
jgi:hypothetical protein